MQKKTKKSIIRAAASVMLAALFLQSGGTLSFGAVAEAEKAKKNAAAQRKQQLEAERKKTQATIDRLNGLKSDVTQYIRELDKSLEEIGDEIDRLNGEIGGKEEEIRVTGEELAEAEAVADDQYADMKLRIKYMYEKGDTGFLDLLLNAKNLTDFFNHAEYVEKISEYDRTQLLSYEAACEEVREKKEVMETEMAELEDLKSAQVAKQESEKVLLASKQEELAGYNLKIDAAEDEVSAYNERIAAEQKEIEALEAEIRRQEEIERKRREEEERKRKEEEARKAAAASGGSTATANLGSLRLTWPCPGSGRITSSFGKRNSPTKGASTMHNGIDIGAPSGTAIVAAASGEVVTASYSSSAGNYIMISHGGGVYTLYMHCSKLNVSEGQQVKAGQTIGKVGSTGVSTGPHLHFGIRANGGYVNPSKYVSP